MHSEIQLYSWLCGQDEEHYNWLSQQDTQQVGEPEVPLDGGSQWPPHRMWYCVAVVLLMWAPVEDWEVVDGSPDSIGKALQAASFLLPMKVAQTAAGTVGWIFLTPLKANMNSAVCNAAPVHSVQRCLEELERHTLALELTTATTNRKGQ